MKICSTTDGGPMLTKNALDDFCAKRLKALADPIRWAVLRSLMTGPKIVAELLTELGIEQTLLSHHLRILKNSGFVVSVREGKNVRCRLADNILIAGTSPSIDLGCCRLEMNC
jgi:DNA-binding transcriptional ArsR family regulator